MIGISLSAQDDVLNIAEQMPIYGDCTNEALTASERKTCSDKAILGFFGEHITYPDTARAAGTEGTVVLRFVVDDDGRVSDPKILKDIGHGCGDEALRVLGKMESWTPGQHQGKKVKVLFTLPIRFKLQNIPVTIREERFEVLRHLFCENYMADFVKKDRIVSMADDELDTTDICGVGGVVNYIKSLKITRTRKDQDTIWESADGSITTEIRQALRSAQVGDAFALDYIMAISLDQETEHRQEVYKSVIVE
jgi:TonB family protein